MIICGRALRSQDKEMREETVSLEFNRGVGKDIWRMGFRSPGLASIAMPGQFLMIRVDGVAKDPLLRRPFSIHGIDDGNRIMILYKVVGRGTSLLSLRNAGDSISVIGPLGKGFPPPEPNESAILVAGGMGLAPLYFLAQALNRDEKRTTKMFLGFPTAQEVVLIDQFKDLNVDLSLATEDGSMGFKGPVTDLFEQSIDRDSAKRPMIYACGPNPMLKKVVKRAMTLHHKCYVSLEGYMACGLGICLGCAVKAARDQGRVYYYVCQDGPVFPAEMIDWEAM
jgi:dihydroorotate dehydrogenase electron transfer subunit